MRIQVKKGYILVVSRTLGYLCGWYSGHAKLAKGAAFYPFIFVQSEELILPWLIIHERIHFRQQLETLIIGSFLITWSERLYARLVLKKNRFEAYLWSSSEQEAYRNMHDDTYLEKRKCWAQFRYMKNKKKITFNGPGQIILE